MNWNPCEWSVHTDLAWPISKFAEAVKTTTGQKSRSSPDRLLPIYEDISRSASVAKQAIEKIWLRWQNSPLLPAVSSYDHH
jgi:hypothetical protein